MRTASHLRNEALGILRECSGLLPQQADSEGRHSSDSQRVVRASAYGDAVAVAVAVALEVVVSSEILLGRVSSFG